MNLYDLQKRNLVFQVTNEELFSLLEKNDTLKPYIGFDPTADSLHVGSLLPIITAIRFARTGKTKPIILLGGATALIGDPSGKSKERSLQQKETVSNFETKIEEQLVGIFHNANVFNSIQIVNNNQWIQNLNLLDFLRDIGKHFSVNALVQRETFKKRLETKEQSLSFTEFSYPLLQSFDFCHLNNSFNVNCQIGGSDQWGNIVSGVELCRRINNSETVGLTLPLLLNKNGNKFGKTEEGAIWLSADKTKPFIFHSFWLNLDDDEVKEKIFQLSLNDIESINKVIEEHEQNPSLRKAQNFLADEITGLVHGKTILDKIKRTNQILFSKKQEDRTNKENLCFLANIIPCFELKASLLDGNKRLHNIFVGEDKFFSSKAEFRKAVQSNSISINGDKIKNVEQEITPEMIEDTNLLVKFGKKTFFIINFVK